MKTKSREAPREFGANIATERDLFSLEEKDVSHVVYVSKSRIERKKGPLGVAYLPGVANR